MMPAILLAVTGADPQPWEERLRALAPRRDIYLWPQRLGDPADVAYACAWHAPRGLFARLPRLQAIFSLGAGVDHVFADPELPDVPVVRIVDPDLTASRPLALCARYAVSARRRALRAKRAVPYALRSYPITCGRHRYVGGMGTSRAV